MFSSTTTGEYSILECPPMSSLLMTKASTPTKWKCSNNNNIEIAPNCPRCASSNTKFCYYNNYSLSQPRYFCKGCRRYWTKGGSLRNVPVGGGCRKSRRARAAVRQSGVQSYLGPNSSPVSAGSTNESETGTDIDLAAVFANYVNQNVDNNKESLSSGASSGSSENFPALEDDTMFEYQKEVDLISGTDFDRIQQVLVPDDQISMHEESNGQGFVYRDSGLFEMQQGILGDDELAAGMLWSEGTDLHDFGSENGSTVQIQDFGLFSPDDQPSVSANLVTDNWGSFDLSAYEFDSRP